MVEFQSMTRNSAKSFDSILGSSAKPARKKKVHASPKENLTNENQCSECRLCLVCDPKRLCSRIKPPPRDSTSQFTRKKSYPIASCWKERRRYENPFERTEGMRGKGMASGCTQGCHQGCEKSCSTDVVHDHRKNPKSR